MQSEQCKKSTGYMTSRNRSPKNPVKVKLNVSRTVYRVTSTDTSW